MESIIGYIPFEIMFSLKPVEVNLSEDYPAITVIYALPPEYDKMRQKSSIQTRKYLPIAIPDSLPNFSNRLENTVLPTNSLNDNHVNSVRIKNEDSFDANS